MLKKIFSAMREFFIVIAFKILNFLVYLTLKIEKKNYETYLKFIENKENFILAFWHGEQFILSRFFKGIPFYILVSLSRDGRLNAKYLKSMGFKTVDGSATRHGERAILQYFKAIKKGFNPLAVAADGPRGPVFKAKEGIFFISKKKNLPVLPVRVIYDNYYVLRKTWDKYKIPKPFSRVKIVFGEPFVAQDENLKTEAEKFDKIMANLEGDSL